MTSVWSRSFNWSNCRLISSVLGSKFSILQSPMSVREREVIFNPSPAQSYPIRAAVGVSQENVIMRAMKVAKFSMACHRVWRSAFRRVMVERVKWRSSKAEGEIETLVAARRGGRGYLQLVFMYDSVTRITYSYFDIVVW